MVLIAAVGEAAIEANLKQFLLVLFDYRGFRGIWGDWSRYHWPDFGQLWLKSRHEPPHSHYCE